MTSLPSDMERFLHHPLRKELEFITFQNSTL